MPTPQGKTLQEKLAYDHGVLKALLHLSAVKISAAEEKEVPPPKNTGRETRLRKDHQPHSFYLLKRNFERAGAHKKVIGEHHALRERAQE